MSTAEEQKVFAPTPQRLLELKRSGIVPYSRDLHPLVLVLSVIVVSWMFRAELLDNSTALMTARPLKEWFGPDLATPSGSALRAAFGTLSALVGCLALVSFCIGWSQTRTIVGLGAGRGGERARRQFLRGRGTVARSGVGRFISLICRMLFAGVAFWWALSPLFSTQLPSRQIARPYDRSGESNSNMERFERHWAGKVSETTTEVAVSLGVMVKRVGALYLVFLPVAIFIPRLRYASLHKMSAGEIAAEVNESEVRPEVRAMIRESAQADPVDGPSSA